MPRRKSRLLQRLICDIFPIHCRFIIRQLLLVLFIQNNREARVLLQRYLLKIELAGQIQIDYCLVCLATLPVIQLIQIVIVQIGQSRVVGNIELVIGSFFRVGRRDH